MSPSPARPPPTITSYYRHLCAAVKIRGALGRFFFIEVARCKGSLFYGAARRTSAPAAKSFASSPRIFKIPILIRNRAFLSFCLFQVPKPVDYSVQPWYARPEPHLSHTLQGAFFSLANRWLALPRRFAGPMERLQAEAELINRVNSTYLVRHRSREYTEYAVSIK